MIVRAADTAPREQRWREGLVADSAERFLADRALDLGSLYAFLLHGQELQEECPKTVRPRRGR